MRNPFPTKKFLILAAALVSFVLWLQMAREEVQTSSVETNVRTPSPRSTPWSKGISSDNTISQNPQTFTERWRTTIFYLCVVVVIVGLVIRWKEKRRERRPDALPLTDEEIFSEIERILRRYKGGLDSLRNAFSDEECRYLLSLFQKIEEVNIRDRDGDSLCLYADTLYRLALNEPTKHEIKGLRHAFMRKELNPFDSYGRNKGTIHSVWRRERLQQSSEKFTEYEGYTKPALKKAIVGVHKKMTETSIFKYIGHAFYKLAWYNTTLDSYKENHQREALQKHFIDTTRGISPVEALLRDYMCYLDASYTFYYQEVAADIGHVYMSEEGREDVKIGIVRWRVFDFFRKKGLQDNDRAPFADVDIFDDVDFEEALCTLDNRSPQEEKEKLLARIDQLDGVNLTSKSGESLLAYCLRHRKEPTDTLAMALVEKLIEKGLLLKGKTLFFYESPSPRYQEKSNFEVMRGNPAIGVDKVLAYYLKKSQTNPSLLKKVEVGWNGLYRIYLDKEKLFLGTATKEEYSQLTAIEKAKEEEGDDCPICLEKLSTETDDVVVTLGCGHRMHEKECLNPWLEESNTCPLCRKPVE